MGFFERFTRSLLGKNGAGVATSAETRSYAGPPRVGLQSPLNVISVAPKGREPLGVSTSSYGAAAVAVAELPRVDQSSNEQAVSIKEPSGTALFEGDLDEHLTDVFETLVAQDVSSEGQTVSVDAFAADQSAVEDLFADIAANYARPIKNFIFELKRGTATKEWVEICRPAMRGITRAAEGMGLSLAAKYMVDFEAALSLAQKSDKRVLNGELRDLLLWCYQDLVKVMPQAFVVNEEEQQREGIIIHSLLMQIPSVGQVTLEKLYRAGLTSLDTLYLAKGSELAGTTGIPLALSQQICAKFQDYRARSANSSAESAGLGQRARLATMLAELRRNHQCFQRASESEWSNPALSSEKRDYRRRRQSCILEINVLLAEVGELDLVNELERLSPERCIHRLEEYLASAPAAVQSR